MNPGDPAAVVAAVAGYQLSGCPLMLPSKPLEADAWDGFCYDVRHQELVGCAGKAVADGALATTSAQHDAISGLYRKAMVSTLQAESGFIEAVRVLQDARVEYRAMEGVALAHLAYPDPGWRPFDLVALLVLDRLKAATVLTDAGWRNEQGRTGSDGSDHTDLYGPAGTQLRLYDRLGSGQQDAPSSCFETSLSFAVGGLTVAALAPELLLLRTCYEAAFAIRGKLRASRDICQLLTELSVDVETTRRLSQGYRMEIVVGLALSATRDALALGDPGEDAGRPDPPGASERPSSANPGPTAQGLESQAKPAVGWLQAWSAVG